MSSRRPSARTWRITAAVGFWLLVVLGALVGGWGGLAIAYGAGLWLAAFSLLAWRAQDEFERAAQKFSWVFGGLFGLLLSLALLPVLLQPAALQPLLSAIGDLMRNPDGVTPDPTASAVLLGALWIAIGQLVGFLVCWVGWHVMKR